MRRTVVLKSVAKSLIPFLPAARRLKRRIVPYQDDPGNSRLALANGLQMIGLLRSADARIRGDVLEVGSGWVPVIPLLFHLCGARRVVMTDIERLMDAQTIERARQVVGAELGRVARELGLDEAEAAARLRSGFDPDYLVGWDSARHPAGSVDVVVSRAVLEHVPPPAIEAWTADFSRILRPGGVMCHVIDNSDHWEHHDKTLSRIDFLRYEDGLFWRLACRDPQAYQNRLRHSDYLALFRRHGWTAVVDEGTPDEKCLRDLRTLPLASPFRGRDPRDLAILSSVFVLRRTSEVGRAAPAGIAPSA